MPSPYSNDLRKRVMDHYERHGSATLTSQVFSISRSVIYDWKKLKASTGSLKAKGGYQAGYNHKIQNAEEFRQCVEENSGLTLQELIKKSGIEMSLNTCSRQLKKRAITRKKRLTDSKNVMKLSEKLL